MKCSCVGVVVSVGAHNFHIMWVFGGVPYISMYVCIYVCIDTHAYIYI